MIDKTPISHPKGRRRQRIPPPITLGAERYDAQPFLEDFPGDLGILLWKTAQSIEVWARASEADRTKLFASQAFGNRIRHFHVADVELELAEPLVVAADVLRGAADALQIAKAARTVSVWASERKAIATSLAFMQVAALVLPDDAELALEVGRIARTLGDSPRAETWFRHAAWVSRGTGAWESYGTAYLAIGAMHASRGNIPAARKAGLRALRAGKRHSVRELQGRAHHDLMQLALLAGKEKESTKHGQLAMEIYGKDHPRLSALANDVAYHWMVKGYFQAALPVLLALRGKFHKPWEALFLFANIARSAAGAGDAETFEDAWKQAIELLNDVRTQAWAPAALVDLARGALQSRQFDRARGAASAAAEMAASQGQNQVAFEAEALLQEISGELSAAGQEPTRSAHVPRYIGQLSHDLVALLRPVDV